MANEEWVTASQIPCTTEKELAKTLRGYKPSGLWEIRGGVLWVNTKRLGNATPIDKKSATKKRRQQQCSNTDLKEVPRRHVRTNREIIENLLRKQSVVMWGGSEFGYKDRSQGEQYVYFVECEGFVKIGVARWPEKRLTVMQGGNPYPMRLWGLLLPKEKTPFELEADLHTWMRPYNHHLEWFNNEGLAFLSSIRPQREAVAGSIESTA